MVSLRTHPYAEVFVVKAGKPAFTVGKDIVMAPGGHIVVAPTGTPHGFVNSGTRRAKHVDIHTAGRMVPAWLEG